MKKLILGTLLVSATSLMADGASLYKKCAGCHGADADKKALGKSEVIKGWSASKIEKALKEYKAGTRDVNGMGFLMKGQIAPYSDAQIKELAKHISDK